MKKFRQFIVDLERFIQYGDLPTSYYVKRGLTVGKRFHRQSGCKLDPSHCWLIEIGNDVTLSSRVQIIAHDDSPRTYTGYGKIGRVIIGDNVFVGAGTIILMNVRIGNHVIIGAGSVVTHDIPDNSIAAGIPAKIIDTTQNYLEQLQRDLFKKPVFDKSYTIYEKVGDYKKNMMKEVLTDRYGFLELGSIEHSPIAKGFIKQNNTPLPSSYCKHYPIISVIIPVYNTGKYLEKCIGSILNQTIKNIEIILVNDGSSDNSFDIISSFEKKDNRIRVVNKRNGGLSSARNAGINVANGIFLAFIDSDDWIGNKFLEDLLSMAVKSEDVDIVISKLTLVDTVIHSNVVLPGDSWQNQILYGRLKEEHILLPLLGPPDNNMKPVKDFLQMCVWKNLYRKEFIDQYHLRFYSEREIMLEDFDFNIRAYLYARGIAICDSAEYHHLLVKDSLSKAYRPDRLLMEKKLLKRTEDFLLQEERFLTAKEEVMNHFHNFIRKSCVNVIYNCSCLSKENSVLKIKDTIHLILEQQKYKSVFSEKYRMKDQFYYRYFCYLISKRQIVLLTYSMILSHILNYVYRLYVKVKAEGILKWKKV